LAALALDVASTGSDAQAAVARWKMPPRRFVWIVVGEDRRKGREGREGREGRDGRDRRRDGRMPPGSTATRALFAHVLGVTDAARRRFSVGPLQRPAPDDQPVRLVFDPRSWDASHVINAPGQSELPDSPHFADLAALWSRGEMIPLAFSESAVSANAEATLNLVPRRVSARVVVR